MNQAELREALTAANASPLINKVISPMLFDLQRRYSPLVRSIPSMKWDVDTYTFNTRNANPLGGLVTDGGTRVQTSSVYTQTNFPMKHFLTVGAVTGYAQAVTKGVIGDLLGKEVMAAGKGLYWDMETQIVWGNAGSTQFGAYPGFDGFDTTVSTFSGSDQNAVAGTALPGGGVLNLQSLDVLADLVESNTGQAIFDSSWMYVMSSTANSQVSHLLTANQRFVDKVEVAAGLVVPTYRGIPIIKSSFLSTRSTTMGAVTSATATTGGTLAASTYNYRVGAVIARAGEIAGSVNVAQVTTGATSTVTLSFSTPGGLDNLGPILYKVYRGTTSTNHTLLGYVDATVGLAADGITPIATTSIIDTGATLIPANGATQPATFPATYQGTNAVKVPAAVGFENIFLVSRDEDNIVRPWVREMQPLSLYPGTTSPDSLPYAMISDSVLAIRAKRFIGGLYNVNTAIQ